MPDREKCFELLPDRLADSLQMLAEVSPEPLPEPDPSKVPNQFMPASLHKLPGDPSHSEMRLRPQELEHARPARPQALLTACLDAEL